jgi:hypothetical protein
MQRQDSKLGLDGVPSGHCLTPSHPRRDRDIAQATVVFRGKRQHIGRLILFSVHAIQATNTRVRNDGHRHRSTRPGWCDRAQPRGESRRPRGAICYYLNQHTRGRCLSNGSTRPSTGPVSMHPLACHRW